MAHIDIAAVCKCASVLGGLVHSDYVLEATSVRDDSLCIQPASQPALLAVELLACRGSKVSAAEQVAGCKDGSGRCVGRWRWFWSPTLIASGVACSE